MNNIIDANKERFIELLKKVNRPGIEDLINIVDAGLHGDVIFSLHPTVLNPFVYMREAYANTLL